jgi:hypothetical protein
MNDDALPPLPPEVQEFIEDLWEENPGADAATIRKLLKEHVRTHTEFRDEATEVLMMRMVDEALKEYVKDPPSRHRR